MGTLCPVRAAVSPQEHEHCHRIDVVVLLEYSESACSESERERWVLFPNSLVEIPDQCSVDGFTLTWCSASEAFSVTLSRKVRESNMARNSTVPSRSIKNMWSTRKRIGNKIVAKSF